MLTFAYFVVTLTAFAYDATGVNAVPSPIVIVPGLTGSQLNVIDSRPGSCNTHGQTYELWVNETRFITDVGCVHSELSLNYDSENDRYYDQEGVKITAARFGHTTSVEFIAINDVFQLGYLNGFVEYFVQRGYVRGKTIRAATYDWRHAAGGLEEKGYFEDLRNLVEEMYEESGNTKVTMMAQSLGAPVSLHFLTAVVDQAWKDKYIHAYVSLGGAWAGATKSLQTIITGLTSFDSNNGLVIILERFFNVITNTLFRSFGSVHWMIPRSSVIGSDTVVVITPTKNYTANDYKQLFEDAGYPDSYIKFQGIEKYNIDWPAPNVPTYCYYGIGLNTTSAISYDVGDFPNRGPTSIPGDGDGTVSRPSLEVCNRWAGGDYPFKAMALPGAEHVAIASDERVLNEFARIVGAPAEPLEKCQLSVDPGPCDNDAKRYFFNYTSGICEKFNYGGCHGNNNNFFFKLGCNLNCNPNIVIATVLSEHYSCTTDLGYEGTVVIRFLNCHRPNPERSDCDAKCRITYFHACYYSDEPRPLPGHCDTCQSYPELHEAGSKCFKRWAVCVRRANEAHRPRGMAERTQDRFKCYEHPCN